MLAIICFFLPWIVFDVDGARFASLTGLQIASGQVIHTSEGVELFHGLTIDYIVPIAGVVVLVLLLFALRRGYVNELDALGTTGLSVIALLIIWGQFAIARQHAAGEGVVLQFQYGMMGVYLALLALIVAGVLNVRAVGERKPSFQATLGAWGFMSPATILVAVFFFLPAVILLYLSLTDLASANFSANPFEWNFIRLGNYRTLFKDTFLRKIIGNTFRYVVFTLGFFNVGLALVLALLTSHISRRAGFFFRLLWLLPRITPSVVYIVMWQRFVQTPPYGIINWFIGLFGGEHQPYWLTEAPWLFVILVNGFVGASFGLIIFSSAIEAIPKDLFTAAKVDGASAWQIVRDITLPQLKWPLLFVTSYQTLSLLVSFEYILLLTNGGPGLYKTEVWALTAYHRALQTYFGSHQWGYGAAWGFILVIIGIVLAAVYLRVFRFNELVQEPKIDVL
ncbi:MAG: carbohydrate ABC transporter permease [Anaerolineae bacterium]